jgi:hypothetical protein
MMERLLIMQEEADVNAADSQEEASAKAAAHLEKFSAKEEARQEKMEALQDGLRSCRKGTNDCQEVRGPCRRI